VVGGMETEAEGMNHMAPEVEGMNHMAPEVEGIKLGEAAKNRHWSDDVPERHHLGLLVTRWRPRDP
jgi:hypothetical protein